MKKILMFGLLLLVLTNSAFGQVSLGSITRLSTIIDSLIVTDETDSSIIYANGGVTGLTTTSSAFTFNTGAANSVINTGLGFWSKAAAGAYYIGTNGYGLLTGTDSYLKLGTYDSAWQYYWQTTNLARSLVNQSYANLQVFQSEVHITDTTTVGTTTKVGMLSVGGDVDLADNDVTNVGLIHATDIYSPTGTLTVGNVTETVDIKGALVDVATDYWDISYGGALSGITTAAITTAATINTLNYGVSSTGSDSYSVTLSPALASYTAGTQVWVKPDTDNTGACTLNVNNLGTLNILDQKGQNPVDSYIDASGIFGVIHNGTWWVLITPDANP